LLSELRERKLNQRLSTSNITSFQLNWQTVFVQPARSTETSSLLSSSSSSEKSSGNQDRRDDVGESETTSCDVVGDDHERYIGALCDEFYNKLTTLIRRSCRDDDDDDDDAVTVSEAKTSPSATDAENERKINDVDVVVSTDGNASGTVDGAATHDKDTEGNSANIEREEERNKDKSEKVTETGRKASRAKRVDDDEMTHKSAENEQTVGHSVSSRRRRLYDDDVAVEVLQHLHFARSRCEVFHGRQECLKAIVDYVSGHT